MNIVLQLREQAAEIAAEGHFGWGNTMLEAARIIEELQAAQQSVQPTVLTHCPNDGNLLLMGFCDQCKSQYPHSG